MTQDSDPEHDGAMLSPAAAQIELINGKFMDLYEPRKTTDALDIEVISHALGMLCRYNGHVKDFYSVADHSVLVHDLLRAQGASRELLMMGLMHDAPEAMLGDVVSPLKWALKEEEMRDTMLLRSIDRLPSHEGWLSAYETLTHRMEEALEVRFSLPSLWDSFELKECDMWALRIEAQELLPSKGESWRWPKPLPREGQRPPGVVINYGRHPAASASLWRSRWASLMDGGPGLPSHRW